VHVLVSSQAHRVARARALWLVGGVVTVLFVAQAPVRFLSFVGPRGGRSPRRHG
jgi:hypothetical protein